MYYQSNYAKENPLRGYDFHLTGVITEAQSFWEAGQDFYDDVPVFKFTLGRIDSMEISKLKDLEEKALRDLVSPFSCDLEPKSEIWRWGRFGRPTEDVYFESLKPFFVDRSFPGPSNGDNVIDQHCRIRGHLSNSDKGAIYAKADIIEWRDPEAEYWARREEERQRSEERAKRDPAYAKLLEQGAQF